MNGTIRWRLLAISLLVIAAVLCACAPEAAEEAPEGNGEEQLELGMVTYALGSDVSQWDPAIVFDVSSVTLLNIYEPLLYYNPFDDDFEPALAVDWEHNEDATVWTFHLREGVTFHDGEPFNAEAVKYAIERTVDIDQGPAFLWGAVETIKVIDEYTVEFVLDYPVALDLIASSGYGTYMVSPAAAERGTDWFNEGNAVGTGPYRLREWVPGEQIVLDKFDDYWGGWDRPHFEIAVIKIVREWSTARQLLEAGDVDLVRNIPLEAIPHLEANPEIEIDVTPSFENLLGYLNFEKAPTDCIHVRRAITHALNYDAIVEEVLGGYGRKSVGVLPSSVWGHAPDLDAPEFDLGFAEEILSESPYYGTDMQLLLTHDQGNEQQRQISEILKANLSRLGIEMEIVEQPWEIRWPQARSLETAPNIFLMYWWPTTVTPSDWLYTMFRSEDEAIFNLAYYENPEFDDLIDRGMMLEAYDREAAAELYGESQQILLDDAAALFIYEQEYVVGKSASIRGFRNNPAYPHVVFFYQLTK
ncbi:MAG: ABC transporter substrate-binding protein [Bacillota bacterium]